jgi:Secretion system C-terminal sorting domain
MRKENLLIRLLLAIVFLAAAISVANAQQLTVMPGTYLKNNGTINLHNTDVQNNGMLLSANGIFVFSGSNDNKIAGTGTTNMHALQMIKQNGSRVLLQKDISVFGAVSFNGGVLDVGNQQLELVYPAGMLQNESSSSRLTSTGTGEVFIIQTLNAPSAVNPGNLGAVITSAQNLGSTIIKRGHKVQLNAVNDQSIARYFNIAPATNTNLNAALKFHYIDAELNNNAANALSMWQKTTSWTSIGISSADAANKFVETTGINSFTAFTLGKGFASGPLPLQLTMFAVLCKDANSRVQWSTANETNTKQFAIEKSADGINWQTAAVVRAQGNSLQHAYESIIPAGAATYFRLKMEDADGKFTYSPIRTIDCGVIESIVVGPNPTKGKLLITTNLSRPDEMNIRITDMSGKTVISTAWQAPKGLNSHTLDLSVFPAGTYMVSIKGNFVKQASLVVKQ